MFRGLRAGKVDFKIDLSRHIPSPNDRGHNAFNPRTIDVFQPHPILQLGVADQQSRIIRRLRQQPAALVNNRHVFTGHARNRGRYQIDDRRNLAFIQCPSRTKLQKNRRFGRQLIAHKGRAVRQCQVNPCRHDRGNLIDRPRQFHFLRVLQFRLLNGTRCAHGHVVQLIHPRGIRGWQALRRQCHARALIIGRRNKYFTRRRIQRHINACVGERLNHTRFVSF